MATAVRRPYPSRVGSIVEANGGTDPCTASGAPTVRHSLAPVWAVT